MMVGYGILDFGNGPGVKTVEVGRTKNFSWKRDETRQNLEIKLLKWPGWKVKRLQGWRKQIHPHAQDQPPVTAAYCMNRNNATSNDKTKAHNTHATHW